jgi:ADP-dependent phosphofructokinase/glucokinase
MSLNATLSFNSQNDLLLNNLKEFFKNREHLDILKTYINEEGKYSLRIVEWFVINYAKKYFIVYPLTEPNGREKRFKVYQEYKLILKSYKKERFDAFSRNSRIKIPYDQNNDLETTIGQLNFFRWAIENKIFDYIDEHYEEIKNDISSHNKTMKETSKENGTRKKREELSVSACKIIKKEDVKIWVKFS